MTDYNYSVIVQDLLLGGSRRRLDYSQVLDETLSLSDRLLTSQPYAYVTNSVRTSISTLLRLRRRPVRYVSFDLPPAFGHLEPGDTVWAAHELLPEAATGTARYDASRLIPLYVVEVHDPLAPAKLTVKCVDLREVYASWWSPLLTDIGMTNDLNGIALLDRAGGWVTERAQVAYGIRPPADDAYQEVLANTPVVDALGLQLEGGDSGGGDTEEQNLCLNSTFSEGGPGNTFTSWSVTTSGAAVANEWQLYTLIDATGFRRAVQLATYAAGEASYLSQTITPGFNLNYGWVRVYYKNGGAVDDLEVRIQRSDTSEYWRDSDGTWQGSVQSNALTPKSGVIETVRWVSKAMDFGAAATNVTISVGHFSAVYDSAQITQLQAVEFIVNSFHPSFAYRSPLPTKAAAVKRVANVTYLVNDSAVRVLSPTRGFFKCTVVPHWNHADYSATYTKIVWSADFDGVADTQYLRCYYFITDANDGGWRFENGDNWSAEIATSGATRVTRDTEYEIICRWTSAAVGEHYGSANQVLDIWVDGVKATSVEAPTEQVANSKCNVYLGCTPNVSQLYYLDGHMRNVTIGLHCPADDELLRI